MSPNGRRAWRRAAKKLRRKLGLRWRSQDEWLYGKRWSELVPDLEAHRGHIIGAWFRRHGFTKQGLPKFDFSHPVRVYIGLWGGDGVEYAVKPKPFTASSLVGMTMGARKRASYYEALRSGYDGDISNRKLRLCLRTVLTPEVLSDTVPLDYRLEVRAKYSISQRLRPCPGCCTCKGKPLTSRLAKKVGRSVLARIPNLSKTHWVCGVLIMKDGWDYGIMHREDIHCNGSGVLPARKSK